MTQSGLGKTCAIYVRVSSEDQRCDLQVAELSEYARRKGWHIHRIYQDKASGASPDRKMLAELLRDCRAKKAEIILVWKLDRLYRSMKHAVLAISELQEQGTALVSLKENLDLTEPSGRLLAHVLLAFSEWELATIKSRVRSGLAAAKARGVQLGRRSVITPSVVEEIYRLRDAGVSVRQISTKMNKRVSKSTVDRVLRMRKTAV